MTTSATTLASHPTAPADPFHYGWRYVRHAAPDGTLTFDQVPLTLEDVLYPEVGDFIVHSKAHEDICHYLVDVLNAQVHTTPGAVVLHDVRVAWDVPGLRPNGPDIALIFGVGEQKNWSTFECAEEGVRPALVIEVTSPETRSNDLIEKVQIYAEAGVEQYIIIDSRAWKGREQLYLVCYQLGPTGYRQTGVDELGRVQIGTLNLWLGIEGTHIYCYNTDGTRIGDYVAVEVARLAEVTARIAAQVEAAEAADRAARAAEAQAEAEAQAQAAAQALAEAEAQAQAAALAQAEAEAQAQAAITRLQALEAELERLRGIRGDTNTQ